MKETIKIAILVLLPFLVGCRTPVTPEARYRHRLQSIILPQVDFREASISDVVLFLEAASMAYDTSGQHGEGVTILIDWQRLAGDLAEARPITFHAKNISLFDVLEAVTTTAGLEYRIGPAVIIDRKKTAETQPRGGG